MSFRWQERQRLYYLRIVETTSSTPRRPGTELVATPPRRQRFAGPTAYGPTSFAPAFQARKGGTRADSDFDRNDRYTIEARVRWHCDGATSDVEAEYVFNGVGVEEPTVANTSWNIVPA